MEQSPIGSSMAASQVGTVVPGSAIIAKPGWSWGACMFNMSFLVAVKQYKLLWWYLLALIPFVNIVFMIGFMIYLGVKGHEIAAAGTQFANQSEYDGFMKGINHAGKVFFFAMLVFIGVALVLGFASFMSFLSPFKFLRTPPPMVPPGVSY